LSSFPLEKLLKQLFSLLIVDLRFERCSLPLSLQLVPIVGGTAAGGGASRGG
jgi:hypothetical protein